MLFLQARGKGRSLGCLCSAMTSSLLWGTVSYQSPRRRDKGESRAPGQSSPLLGQNQTGGPPQPLPKPFSPQARPSLITAGNLLPPSSPSRAEPCNQFRLGSSLVNLFNNYLLSQTFFFLTEPNLFPPQGLCMCSSLYLELPSPPPLTQSLCPLIHECLTFVFFLVFVFFCLFDICESAHL